MKIRLYASGTPLTPARVVRRLVIAPCGDARAVVRYVTWTAGSPCGVNIEYKVNNVVVYSRGPVSCNESGTAVTVAPCNGIHQLAAWGCPGCFWGVEVEVELDVLDVSPVVLGAAGAGALFFVLNVFKRQRKF
jgi:hypothetical protein